MSLWHPDAARAERWGSGAFVASLLWHLALAAGVFLLRAWPADENTPRPERRNSPSLVWLAIPGPSGGGGGGGERNPQPVRQAASIGRERISVPASPPDPVPQASTQTPVDQPPALLEIAARPLAASTEFAAGLIAALPPGVSRGTGDGPGAGSGHDGGAGPGDGNGLDDGALKGEGGRAYRVGTDISAPRPIRQVRPNYTSSAMAARLTGTAILECVVNADGSVGEIRLVRSLDASLGLDEEAIRAVRQWRFVPGRRRGEPVPVWVRIELAFSLH